MLSHEGWKRVVVRQLSCFYQSSERGSGLLLLSRYTCDVESVRRERQFQNRQRGVLKGSGLSLQISIRDCSRSICVGHLNLVAMFV